MKRSNWSSLGLSLLLLGLAAGCSSDFWWNEDYGDDDDAEGDDDDGPLSQDGPLSLDRLDITNDSNSDGVLSPGESARISYMVFRNAGDSDILDLTGFVSSSSPYVSFTSLNLSLSAGVCYSGGTCSESDDFLFDISLSTPAGTSITIDIDLIDQFNNSYHLEYTTEVVDDDVQLSLDRLDITNDSNGDGLLSPGESARISYMVFRNAGDSDILDLTGFVSSSSPHVSFTSLNLSLSAGVCYSGGTCSESDDFLFDISLSTPAGTSITIDIDLIDQFNNSYHLEYTTEVVDDDVQLSLDRLDITNDSNGDGLLSPGESARISYMVFRNAGDSDILNLAGFVSSSSPYLSFTSLNLSLSAGVCYSGGTCSESDDFLFDVSLSTPVGTSITIDIDLSDQFNNSYYLSYDLQVQ